MDKSKAHRIADDIKDLKESRRITPAQTEKSEKTMGKTKHQGTPYKRKGGNGGTRRGSGRKPIEADLKRKTLKRSWENFAQEEVDIRQLHVGTKEIRIVKMQRLRIAQEKLFKKVEKEDVSAIREFNDRVLGKSPLTVRGDEDEAPIQVQNVDQAIDLARKVYDDGE